MSRLAAIVKNTPGARFLLMPLRLGRASSYYLPEIGLISSWLVHSREHTNFTYNLTESNLRYLAHTVSVVTHSDVPKSKAIFANRSRTKPCKIWCVAPRANETRKLQMPIADSAGVWLGMVSFGNAVPSWLSKPA